MLFSVAKGKIEEKKAVAAAVNAQLEEAIREKKAPD